MTRNRKLLIGGLALGVIAAGAVAASAHRGEGGFGRHGGHHGGGMDRMGALCQGDLAEMADHMLVGIEYKVKPTDAQKPAFEELKAAARTAAAKAKAGCPPPKTAQSADGTKPAPKAPTERLALMEAGLAAQLEAIRTVRPAAEKFYAALSDEQKKAFAERGREHGGWGHRGGEGGERGWGHRSRSGDEAPRTPEQSAPDKK